MNAGTNSVLPLSAIEARILGVLVEKEATTPDTYPLSLNALTTGCNQKSAREPVMNLAESEVVTALEALRGHNLVMESYGASGRVLRYTHNCAKGLGVPSAAVALLAVLALRGPQTAAELRAHCERLYRFSDISSVEAYLEELAERASGALVLKLPRQSGAREARWAHLLCGEPVLPLAATPVPADEQGLADRVAALEAEMTQLREALAALPARLPGT